MGALKSAFAVVFLFCCLGLAEAGTYTLTDGQTVSGEPLSYNKEGVVLGSATAKRTSWAKFSQDALQQLVAEAKRPQDAEFIEPFLEETVLEVHRAKKEVVIKEPPSVELPTGKTGLFAAFGSSLGLTIIFILWGANVYAGYETARFRHHPIGLVCGVSAAVPVLGPIAFLCIPPKRPNFAVETAAVAEPEPTAEEVAEEPVVAEASSVAVPPPSPSTSAAARTFKLNTQQMAQQADQIAVAPAPLPPTVTFQRGDFTFNRRFFETKMPGFFRVVPSETDKDMVVYIKCVRGEFIGKRISRITQTELDLLTFKGEVTAEEMIPFGEIYEVQLRHKDMV